MQTMELDKLDETCQNRRTFDIYSEEGGFQEMINDAAILRVLFRTGRKRTKDDVNEISM